MPKLPRVFEQDTDDEEDHEQILKHLQDGLPGKRHANKRIWLVVMVAAIASLIAAFTLSVDAIVLAANPTQALGCDVNAILNCGTVGTSWQAAAFGFPNAFLGMIFSSAVIGTALIGISGIIIPRWYCLALQTGYLSATLFAVWLFYQSMFVIGALCLWCLLITTFTMIGFLALLHYNISQDNIWRSTKARARARAFVRADGDLYASIAWVFLIVVIILIKYGPAVVGL